MKKLLALFTLSITLSASLFGSSANAIRGDRNFHDYSDTEIRNKCQDYLPFHDVEMDDWYHDSVCTLYKLKAVDDNKYFYPHRAITRMEFMKEALISHGINIHNVHGTTFKDMDQDHWAWEVAATAHELGYMNGWDGYIRPDETISRGEALVVLTRMQGRELWGWDKSDIHFKDVNDDDFYAYATIIWHKNGLLEGYSDRTFRGSNNITRGESAQMMTQTLQVWPNADFGR